MRWPWRKRSRSKTLSVSAAKPLPVRVLPAGENLLDVDVFCPNRVSTFRGDFNGTPVEFTVEGTATVNYLTVNGVKWERVT